MGLPSDSKLIIQFEDHRKYSERGLSRQRADAAEAHAFYAGDRMSYEASILDKGRKQMVTFNHVKPFISAVNGFMIKLRRKPKYQAKLKDQELQAVLSDYLNSFSDYIRQNANFDQLESRQNLEMLITGYGAIDTNISWEFNPDGEVRGELIDSNDVFWDSEARETNILDGRWAFRRKQFNIKEALRIFKGSEPNDFEEVSSDAQNNFVYNPEGGLYDKVSYGTDTSNEDLVSVYYYQWWTREPYYRAENPIFDLPPQLGQQLLQLMQLVQQNRADAAENEDVVEDIFEFDPTQQFLTMNSTIKNDLMALFARFEDLHGIDFDVDYVEQLRRVYYTSILTRKKIFRKFKSPDQNGFTIKFKTGSFDKRNNKWFGIVGVLKEPAKYSNKALTEILYVIASNSKGGVMYEKSAVKDPTRFEQSWARSDAAIRVEDGALRENKIQPKAVAALPTGYESLLKYANESLSTSTGLNPEFLGSSENKQVSALMESQRIEQATNVLVEFLDAEMLYQKEEARLNLTFMRMLAENSRGRLFKVLGENGIEEFVELLEDPFTLEYDIDISEVPNTPTQKRDQADIMMAFADKMFTAGKDIYPLVVPFLPIPETEKIKLTQAIQPQEPSPEEQQLQQQMRQLAIEGQEAEVKETNANVGLKLAQAKEKEASFSQKMADSVKKLAEAEQKDFENQAIATLPVDNVSVII